MTPEQLAKWADSIELAVRKLIDAQPSYGGDAQADLSDAESALDGALAVRREGRVTTAHILAAIHEPDASPPLTLKAMHAELTTHEAHETMMAALSANPPNARELASLEDFVRRALRLTCTLEPHLGTEGTDAFVNVCRAALAYRARQGAAMERLLELAKDAADRLTRTDDGEDWDAAEALRKAMMPWGRL